MANSSAPPPTTAPATTDALRLTPGVAWAWVLVSAASPVLCAVAWTALNKEVRPDDPAAAWLPTALGWLAAFTLPAPLLLHAWVLRRAAPRLRWRQVMPALLAAALATLLLAEATTGMRQVQIDFYSAGLQWADLRWDELLRLPWLALPGSAGAAAAVCLVAPAWVFARAARVPPWVPLLAVIAASMAGALLSALWMLAGVEFELIYRSTMNGWSWHRRASALGTQAAAQAIWAVVALSLFTRLARATPGAMPSVRRGTLVAAALSAALLLPAAVAVMGPGGAARLQLVVRGALSPRPAQDSSEGEPLLRYAFSAPLRLRGIPWRASASPDGRWILAVSRGRQVVVINGETGAIAHRFADVLDVHESPAWAWSPDSRWLVLRTHGELLPGRYVRHQARVRLYAVPGFAQAAEYRHSGAQCLAQSHAENEVLFDRAGASVWLACGLEVRPTPTDLVALRLAVPGLQVQTERRYGDAAPWNLRGLKEVDGSVWAWFLDHQQPPYARFHDLTAGRVPVVLRASAEDLSSQAEWTLQEASFDASRVTFRVHAWAQGRRRWVTHDLRTGAMVSRQEDRLPAPDGSFVAALATGGLRIESHMREASQAGELVVRDAADGRVRQRIRTVAQHPLAASADGRLLVTQSGGELRVYRVQRTAGP
jgi:hypothetical protein